VAREAAARAGVGEVLIFGEAEGATPFASLLAAEGAAPEVQIDPAEDLAALPYSSGTTGLPKGVELTHANLVAHARQAQAVMGLTTDDVVVGVAPFFHAIGQNIILPCSLRAGATVVTMPRFDLAGFLGLVQDHRATFTIVVPPIVLALAGHPMVDGYDLSSLRLLGCGAAPLGADVEQRCADRLGCEVVQGFGMTESSAVLAIVPPDAPRRGSAGRLLPGTEARIVDPAGGGDVGPGRTGEVPVAHVATRSQVGAAELQAWVAEWVAPFKRLRGIRFVDQVPRSPTGKLLRRVLVEVERADAERFRAEIEPAGVA